MKKHPIRHRFLVIAAFLSFSCGQQEDAYPKNAIPRDSMVALLADLHVLRAEAQQLSIIDPASVVADSTAWSSKGWSRTEFNATMEWFERHPEELSLVYEEVISELSRREEAAATKSPH